MLFRSPSKLKADRIHGSAWSLDVTPLLEAIEVLSTRPGIARARLDGDRVHVVVAPGALTPDDLVAVLTEQGLQVRGIEAAETTLEDVFSLLAEA